MALEDVSKKIRIFIDDQLPRMIGKTAVEHYQQNFYQGGFVNNGLHPWKRPKRYDADGNAGAQYGTLLSARNELLHSIHYRIVPSGILISSDKPYAAIHNEGGSIAITPKMKAFFWRKHKELTDKAADKTIKTKWKGMALSKELKIPQRQFVGNSRELNDKIEAMIVNEFKKLFR